MFMEFVDQFDFECSEPCDGSFVEVKARRDMRPVGYRYSHLELSLNIAVEILDSVAQRSPTKPL